MEDLIDKYKEFFVGKPINPNLPNVLIEDIEIEKGHLMCIGYVNDEEIKEYLLTCAKNLGIDVDL